MKKDTILFILSEIAKEMQIADIERQLYLMERRNINLKKLGMDYKGKLYGKMGHTYFDTGKTSDDYDELLEALKRVRLQIGMIEHNWSNAEKTFMPSVIAAIKKAE